MSDQNQTPVKTPLPLWAKVSFAAAVGSGLTVTGQKLAVDSPVHFAVEGAAPAEADAQWVCAPEGGIVGAPMVCRPKAEVVAAAAAAAAEKDRSDRDRSTSTDK